MLIRKIPFMAEVEVLWNYTLFECINFLWFVPAGNSTALMFGKGIKFIYWCLSFGKQLSVLSLCDV